MRSAALGLFCLAAAPLAAQPIAPLFETFRPNRSPLAATAEVADGFELYVADPVSRALVNPARLGVRSRRASPLGAFVYGTRNARGAEACALPVNCSPSASLRPAFSVAAATRGKGMRVLVQAEHTTALAGAEDAFQSNPPLTAGSSVDIRALSQHEQDVLRTQTQARLAFVWGGGRTAYSVGLFGGYRQFLTTRESLDLRERTLGAFRPPSEYAYDYDVADSFSEARDEAYAAGLEWGVATSRLDLVGSVSYQHRAERQARSLTQEQINERPFTVSGDELRRIESLTADDQAFSASADGTDARLFASVALSDGAFADAVTVEGFGTVGFGEAAKRYARSASTLITEAGEITTDDTFEQAEAQTDLDFDGHAFGGALGYVHRRKAGRAEVMTGLRASALRGERRGGPAISRDPRDVRERAQIEYWSAEVTLPLHVEVPLFRSVRFFGGGVYGYGYRSGLRRFSRAVQPIQPDGSTTETDRADALTSSERFYLGARLRSKAGLAAQVAFRSSLSNYQSWTVSVGYHF